MMETWGVIMIILTTFTTFMLLLLTMLVLKIAGVTTDDGITPVTHVEGEHSSQTAKSKNAA